MFHFLTSNGCKHIPSHKEQTEHAEVKVLKPQKVYISAVDNKAMPLDNAVEVGTSVKVGTLLGIRKDFNLPVYSSVSGKVVGIVKKTSSLLNRPVNHFEIENDMKDEVELRPTLKEGQTKDEVVELIREGGIVGLGGAGFPTYIKYKASDIDTLLVNAVECEPYITTDFVQGTKGDVEFFFKTFSNLLAIFGIQKAVVACKKEREELISSLTSKAQAHNDPRIEVKGVKSVYPAGWERLLIKLALKREYNKLPSEAHVIVDNYQTIEAIGQVLFNGKVIANKQITVSGLVNEPANVIAPVGSLVKDIIATCGGYSKEVVTLVNGGPMCGEHLKLDDVPCLLQTNAYTVLEKKQKVANACLRCGNCSAYCPQNLQPCEINFAAKRNDYDRCYKLGALDCINCGLCSYVCPSQIEVTEGVKKAKLLTMLKSPLAKKK